MAVSLFFHGVEEPEGRWRCQHGRTIFDTHPDKDGAITHLRDLAGIFEADAEIFLHHLDGRTEAVPAAPA